MKPNIPLRVTGEPVETFVETAEIHLKEPAERRVATHTSAGDSEL